MTNDERNTALAALFGPEGYEAAKTCPQGHNIWVAVEHPNYDDHDEYVMDIGYQAGALCLICMTLDQELVRGVPTDNAYYCYDKARSLRRMFDDDPTWHPEWRIQGVPKDFTVPGVLEPMARELVARWHDQDSKYSGWYVLYSPFCEDLTAYTVVLFPLSAGSGSGDTFEIALGEALLNAARTRK